MGTFVVVDPKTRNEFKDKRRLKSQLRHTIGLKLPKTLLA